MRFWDLVEYVRDAVLGSGDVAAWCVANYGAGPTVYVGIDEDDPPGQQEYPLVVIEPLQEESSLDVDYGTKTVMVSTVVYDEEKELGENSKTLRGLKNVAAFHEVVRLVLLARGADLGGSWVERFDGVYEPREHFPIFVASSAYLFRDPDRFDPLAQR